jgi:hypothetical protein
VGLPRRLARSVAIASIVASGSGCVSTLDDFTTACIDGLLVRDLSVSAAESDACAAHDQAIYERLDPAEQDDVDLCVSCIVKRNDPLILCLERGEDRFQAEGPCSSACGGPGVTHFCELGGMPAAALK